MKPPHGPLPPTPTSCSHGPLPPTPESTTLAAKSPALHNLTSPRPTETHQFYVHNNKFTIDNRYKPIAPLGSGAYGVVCSAVDSKTESKVAIKKITKAFRQIDDAKRITREIQLMRHLDHPNIVRVRDLTHGPSITNFDDLYVVMDFMETDLHHIIQSKNTLTDQHVQYFIWQVLCGLKYMHSAQVIHRDLKPANLLINTNCHLKICDLGLARGVSSSLDADLTEYVVTRWYRAPEVLCSQEYDYKIDVWSTGCILAELLGRRAIFPGADMIGQMNLIFSVIGTPDKADMNTIQNAKARSWLSRLPQHPKADLATRYPTASPAAIDLLGRMLTFNPAKRISVDEALSHPYFANLRNTAKNALCPIPFDFTWESRRLSRHVLRELVWEEIFLYRPEMEAPVSAYFASLHAAKK